MKKIYFRIKSIMLMISVPIVYLLFAFLLIVSIENNIIPVMLFTVAVIILITLGIAFGSIYGFKIDDRHIRIVSQQRVKSMR